MIFKMITFQSYYIISIAHLSRLLVKVVAALCRALTYRFLLVYSQFDPISISIRLKPFSLINITLPAGESRPQDCNASLYIKNPCACHCRTWPNGLLAMSAKVIH